MAEPGCEEVRAAAAEAGLGILPLPERAALDRHLRACAACRGEVAAMEAVAARLLDLVPGTEPPLGFDRRALARVAPARRRRPRGAWIVTAAAAAAVAAGALGWVAGAHAQRRPAPATAAATVLRAPLRQGDRIVGEVDAYGGRHPWVSMWVRGSSIDGTVTCELVRRGGGPVSLGSFDVAGGAGAWSAPDPAGTSGVTGAVLVGPDGRVVASATF